MNKVHQTLPRLNLGRRRRADDVADQIVRLIEAGEFPAESQLPPEQELAERFGVGRPAVREALFLLQQQGVVTIKSGTRARVASPSASMLNDQAIALVARIAGTPEGQSHMEQVRLLIEPGVAWQAARHATEEDIAGLKQKLDLNAAAVGTPSEFIRTDVAFHYELTAITRNPVFAAVHEVLVAWLIDQRANTIYMPESDRMSVRAHTSIFEAVAARDPMRAFHEMVSHLRLVSEMYSESKRIADDLLRKMAHEVSERVEREMAAMWGGGVRALGAKDKSPIVRKPTGRERK